MSSFQKKMRNAKKQECMAHMKKKKLIGTVSEEAQVLYLLDKDVNCIKYGQKAKETMQKEQKKE